MYGQGCYIQKKRQYVPEEHKVQALTSLKYSDRCDVLKGSVPTIARDSKRNLLFFVVLFGWIVTCILYLVNMPVGIL